MSAAASHGTAAVDVPERLQEAACLTDEQAERLAQSALLIERYYKRPQDVEWAFDSEGRLFILQTRPMNIRPKRPEGFPAIDEATRPDQVIFAGKGTVVQRGVAAGRAFVVNNEDDLKRFPLWFHPCGEVHIPQILTYPAEGAGHHNRRRICGRPHGDTCPGIQSPDRCGYGYSDRIAPNRR